jgi:hypothetical protein
MRLLVLYQARDAKEDHPGYYDGFEQLVTEGILEKHSAIAYWSVANKCGWETVWEEAYKRARDIEADTIFLQFFQGPIPDPSKGINRLKCLPNKPTMFVSLGDPYGRWTNRVPRGFRVASALSDVSFLTGMGYLARQLRKSGSKNVVLMPHGACQVRFSIPPRMNSTRPDFDVVFVGSRMRARNPLGHFCRVGRMRVEFVERITRRYGRRLGLFGKGWNGNPAWQGSIPYAAQCEAYRRSEVVLGGTPNAYCDYYMSDRPFIAAASGIPLVDYWVPGVERILEPRRDWWLARNLEEMLKTTDQLLELSSQERSLLGNAARSLVLNNHTQYQRCKEMVGVVKAVRDARLNGRRAAKPVLEFLSASRGAEPAPDAVLGWEG